MLDAALAYINNHLEENITLDKLASVTGYSPYYLHRKLKEELQEPVGNFIIKQRVQSAAYLLHFTELSVTDIRLLVGYDNDSAFSRVFKKVKGISPREFRKKQLLNASSVTTDRYISLKCEIVRLPKQQAVLFPCIGNYFSRDIFRVWEKVGCFLQEQNLSPENFTFYSVFHDCQNVNPDSVCRYDAAIVSKNTAALSVSKNFVAELPGGKFARYKFCCPVAEYEQVTRVINEHLFCEMKLKHRDSVSYFQYYTLPTPASLDNLFIEWYLPVH
ncbi:GyrI-like domain-containing protein [Pontibacter toksunensis]|uniref:GyrI-like domain-containing protein n=1 Tax=Pontibacter toksunensis TaxID=1332631 RepID=A0ABW6BYV7_9BACT